MTVGVKPRTVSANGVEIAYETFGAAEDRPLLLVMGLGTQMLAWHDDFCADLAARGFRVVRFDNRDCGLSTHLHAAGAPDLETLLADPRSVATYTVEDMADDAAGLLEALGIPAAHVVGASMGGMIAQALAAGHPDKVRSLTSIMSTPSPAIGAPTPEAMAALLAPPPTTRAEAVERAVLTYRVIGSPGFPLEEPWLRDVAARAFDRSFDPAGVVRQLAAIQASGDRTEALRAIAVPTLVVHGDADPLVQPDGGRATAAAIPGAELIVIPGMGHNLPREIWPDLVARIVKTADAGDARSG
ncbi:MAG TPA: alpha/beta fold hydrolase [Mycobacteriales bacterium]|nr:alpha/beta fold hydrolase [Mycobacteriales bacterium]